MQRDEARGDSTRSRVASLPTPSTSPDGGWGAGSGGQRSRARCSCRMAATMAPAAALATLAPHRVCSIDAKVAPLYLLLFQARLERREARPRRHGATRLISVWRPAQQQRAPWDSRCMVEGCWQQGVARTQSMDATRRGYSIHSTAGWRPRWRRRWRLHLILQDRLARRYTESRRHLWCYRRTLWMVL